MFRKAAAVKQPRNVDGDPRVASDPIELKVLLCSVLA